MKNMPPGGKRRSVSRAGNGAVPGSSGNAAMQDLVLETGFITSGILRQITVRKC